MNTEKHCSDHINKLLDKARESPRQTLSMIDACEPLLRALPPDIVAHAGMAPEWIQFSNLSHQEAMQTMNALKAGRWTRCPSQQDGFLDFEATVGGVRVILFAAAPPGSCRIIDEEVTVPAITITRRRLVCS